ncbi:Acetyltransferase (GNAT) family protein [Filimonas lacunae]|uniref:Acetyltransferase (GNAT) family protein n=1 Tax=Filimonas lacunae TaxID=477680 RepID=A0A173MFI9_9BACT|nr:GNAT family N-acetyltransferase [Filimonas lacunae]BAV06384.1 acetyltransferase [Filimonas lacunae]SIT26732.1 Acetyltransferase (GNAT) family protein [Filimonas lacunae]
MINLKRTTSEDPDFIALVLELDADLAARNGEEQNFYGQFNKLDSIKHVVVAYSQSTAVSCGAIKVFDTSSMEVKRMFTRPEARGNGIASQLLAELERWTAELAFTRCVLETGIRHTEAISLYQKSGYQLIPNYGQYAGVDTSVCFEKNIAG